MISLWLVAVHRSCTMINCYHAMCHFCTNLLWQMKFIFYNVFFFFLFFFFLFTAAPAASGSAWARGSIRTVAEATTATATLDLSRTCDLRCNLWQRRILNPLSETRD